MFGILKKFFDFCGEENRRKFKISIALGAVQAIGEAMKIPAVMVIVMAMTRYDISAKYIWASVVIMAVSFAVSFLSKKRSTMLQTEGGYDTAAFKRIEIARHLRYLPMGISMKTAWERSRRSPPIPWKIWETWPPGS